MLKNANYYHDDTRIKINAEIIGNCTCTYDIISTYIDDINNKYYDYAFKYFQRYSKYF